MTASTVEEYKAYLTRNNGFPWGISVDEGPHFAAFYSNVDAQCVEIPFPTSAGEFANLASTLALRSQMDWAEWGGGTLVYQDWGVWGQLPNLAGYQMIERIRSTFGEVRPFHLAPVHSFRQDEQHLLTSFVLAALIYGWDAYYIPNYEGWFAHISHDGYCHIATKRQTDFADLLQKRVEDPEWGYKIVQSSRLCRRS